MSTDYNIACKDCKKSLWIAQGSIWDHTLYTGEPETMQKLKDFLFDHICHELAFEGSQYHEDFEKL